MLLLKTPVLDQDQRSALKEALAQDYGVGESEITEDNISGVVSSEMRQNAVLSVVISGILMLIYIWIRFKDFKIGASAVIALLHDVLVVLAVYARAISELGNTQSSAACILSMLPLLFLTVSVKTASLWPVPLWRIL